MTMSSLGGRSQVEFLGLRNGGVGKSTIKFAPRPSSSARQSLRELPRRLGVNKSTRYFPLYCGVPTSPQELAANRVAGE